MTRRQLHRALARRTGEPLSVICRLGFQLWNVPTPVPPRHRGQSQSRRRPVLVPAA